ncbi:hypothetical protein [Amycolatopsis sp. WAC 01375]|uniref:Orn/Lys/Arg family decarboxylase n=1 Tax=Amycolatopsis sp. WAC 01375 TaxID=2203194 RepID=UPI001F3392BC|nr:hypothetical protein [Amycolatopsis sp. WAC 01375]
MQITHADDQDTVSALLHGLRGLVDHDFERRPPVDLPSGAELTLEMRMLPRDAFFAEAEHVPLDKAEGRVSAEMISPCPPGGPAIAPGKVFTEAIVGYLHTGVRTGMFAYDAADPELGTVRVVT